jgi:hypothetical protein
VVLADALLGEVDADDAGPRGRRVGDDPLLGGTPRKLPR